MPNTLSDQQIKAINAKDSNILVFASAGAGKTTVLVSRLLKRIIEDRISLDQILAMTFTDAAAENMKYRLQKSLLSELNKNPNDQYIQNQLSLLSNANISTIHSFCLSLIKQYYYLLGIKKQRLNNILNDADKAILQLESFKKSISEFKNIRELNNQISTSIFNFDSLFEAINQILKKASSSYDPLVWLNEHRVNLVSSFEDINENIRNYYYEDIRRYLSLAINDSQYLVEQGEDYQLFLDNLNKCYQENEYNCLIESLLSNFKTLPKVQSQNNQYRDNISSNMIKLSEILIKPSTLVENSNKAGETINSLIDLTISYYNNYQSLKEERNVIDFDDFEHFAYRLLTLNNNEIANHLKNTYKEIMIDEFQDTNDSQYKIASLICDHNLFVVGDSKQSIYGFRNARPEIMNNLKRDSSFKLFHLTNNYRSSSSIVNFNNELYSRIMNILSNDYPKEDVQTSCIKETNKPVFLLANSEHFNQYDLIANKIMELHDQGHKFSDIAILVKAHAKKTPIRIALDKYNIPFFLQDKEGYLSSKSLDVIISYLKLLLNKDDLISKLAVLTSSMYKLNDNDLLKLKDNNYEYEPLNEDIKQLNKLFKDNKILDIVYYLLDINDYYANLPTQEKANIDLFINNYNNQYTSLYEFVYYLENSKQYESASASTISKDADVVRIMTIHTAKGLEFNTVFVLSESSNVSQETRSPIHVDSSLGIGVDVINQEYKQSYLSIYSQAIKAKTNKDYLLEYLRLFYVATTRATDNLYIVDEYNEFTNKQINQSLIYQSKGFSSYLFMLNTMQTQIVDKLIDYQPLDNSNKKAKKIPSKNFSFDSLNNEKPSDHYDDTLFYKEVVEYGTYVHECFENIDFLNPNLNDYDNKVKDTISNFLNSDLIKKCLNYQIHKEFEFKTRSTHGYMDFVAIGKDEIILIDYKTNVNTSKDKLIDLYSKQINAYVEALRKIYPQTIKAYLYSTTLKEFIEIQ